MIFRGGMKKEEESLFFFNSFDRKIKKSDGGEPRALHQWIPLISARRLVVPVNTTRDPLNVNAFQPSRFRPTASAEASFIADPKSRRWNFASRARYQAICSIVLLVSKVTSNGEGDSFFFLFSFCWKSQRTAGRVRRVGGGHFRALGSETRRKFVGGDDGLI